MIQGTKSEGPRLRQKVRGLKTVKNVVEEKEEKIQFSGILILGWVDDPWIYLMFNQFF